MGGGGRAGGEEVDQPMVLVEHLEVAAVEGVRPRGSPVADIRGATPPPSHPCHV